MGAVQKRLVQLGLAKQSAFNTPAAAPTQAVGLTGGKVYDVELEEAELDTTWSNRMLGGYDRIGAIPVSDAGFVAMPKSIGLLLYLAFGAKAVTGAGPYTHTFTLADPLPYATIWGKYGSTDSAIMSDAKLDSLELDWDKTGSLRGKAKFMGCAFDPSVAFPTLGAGVAEVVASGAFRGAGGTFTVDGSAVRVTGGSIKINNNVEPIQTSNAVLATDMFEAKMSVEVSLKIKPTDLTLWRKIVTGTVSGTSVSSSPFYGAFDVTFLNGANSLDIASPTVAWSCNMPDADPSGGAAELTVTGRVVLPASGSAITATLINTVTSY